MLFFTFSVSSLIHSLPLLTRHHGKVRNLLLYFSDTTLKYHKENFLNSPTVRLINPAKNEWGRISKAILDNINKRLYSSLNINLWKNTTSTIEWFKRIEQKHLYKLVMFDIKDFYPSIQKELTKIKIWFAREYIDITCKDTEIIYHVHKSLLFDEKDTWIKKHSGLFDVTMGANDGAEVYELVDIYMIFLKNLSFIIEIDI